MDKNFLRELLKHKTEADWFDFKLKLKLYDSEEKRINSPARDELIKDILGLANGNTGIIRKNKYLIVGVADTEFTADGLRKLCNVDYRVPTQDEVSQWVNSACTPVVAGLECNFEEIENHNLYVITIPPTFELHETTRDLIAKGRFSKHTVFMRKGSHTEPASIRDGIAIQQLKLLYRQEILNSSMVFWGILSGALIAVLFWNAGYHAAQSLANDGSFSWWMGQVILVIFGAFFGGSASWIWQGYNSFRYEWRYYSWRQRILAATMVVGLTLISFFALSWLGIL